jgi:type II secretory pathway component PulF
VQTIVVNKTVVAPLQVAPTTVASGSTKELVSSFEKQPQKEGVLPGGGKTLSAPEKAVDRKKILENEEKKAEILMMSAAKKIVPKKAGFFAEFSASMQYMGMAKQRISMIQNLATMLNAGLPLVDALRTLQMETKNKSAKKLLRAIMVAVDNGSPLWRAMDDQHFFSPHAIALIRIGEEAGNLAQNMQYLAAQQEKDQALKEKVQMAMIYPTIVMVLMFGIVVGLGTFVLPSLIGVLQSLNADLPFATIMLIRFTDGFTTYGYIVIPGLIFSALGLAFLAKFTRFKIVTQWITFRIPGIGKLAREATLARFGVILGGYSGSMG